MLSPPWYRTRLILPSSTSLLMRVISTTCGSWSGNCSREGDNMWLGVVVGIICAWRGGDGPGEGRLRVHLPCVGLLHVHRWVVWACILPLATRVQFYNIAAISAIMLGHDIGHLDWVRTVPCSGSDSEASS